MTYNVSASLFQTLQIVACNSKCIDCDVVRFSHHLKHLVAKARNMNVNANVNANVRMGGNGVWGRGGVVDKCQAAPYIVSKGNRHSTRERTHARECTRMGMLVWCSSCCMQIIYVLQTLSQTGLLLDRLACPYLED